MKYLFNISNKTYCNLRLRWNTEDAKFSKPLFQDRNIVPNMINEADYTLRGHYEDKKSRCQVSDYKAWLSLVATLTIIRRSRI